MMALDPVPPFSTYQILSGDHGAVPPDLSADPSPGMALLALLAFVVLCLMPRSRKRRDSRQPTPVPSEDVLSARAIAISQLPAELQEPLKVFRRRGVEYLTPQQLAQIYDDCALVAEHRAGLYEHQAELMKAQTAYDLAAAAAKFVAGLNTEQRALLQMRIEARARLDFDQLQQRNAQLESEVAQYRNLLSGPRQV